MSILIFRICIRGKQSLYLIYTIDIKTHDKIYISTWIWKDFIRMDELKKEINIKVLYELKLFSEMLCVLKPYVVKLSSTWNTYVSFITGWVFLALYYRISLHKHFMIKNIFITETQASWAFSTYNVTCLLKCL